jgi:predicted metalloprotease with PDZ domain
MARTHRFQAVVLALILAATAPAFGRAAAEGTMAFTLSMPQPAQHVYHVLFRCEGLPGPTLDFKMPAWTPGYYGLFDFAKNVRNFRAEDGEGRPLAWEMTSGNAWRVAADRAAVVTVTYDVLATSTFVAQCYLGEDRGYIVPGGVFMYVGGRIGHPVTVAIEPNPAWSTIATGLDRDPSASRPTYAAPDFDVLYDSPILMGNLESLPAFEIRGIRHEFFGYDPKVPDPAKFMADLKAALEAGIAVIGDIPYRHYTFLAIGPGQGGIEHLNSTSFGFNGSGMTSRAGEIRTLSFLAHEYFHLFNVKRIRPIALGPFDYDRENITGMLWVSEGFTSYYEALMLKRAGLTSAEELLDELRGSIVAYENNPGHLFQSAVQSSLETWSQGPFGKRGDGIRKTISYYDKGVALGMLLDFAIRHATANRNSLDTVMRALYGTYFKSLGRGWTDAEFRTACETAAGAPLSEVFEYAATTKAVDYAKYLGLRGPRAGKAPGAPRAVPGRDRRGRGKQVDRRRGRRGLAGGPGGHRRPGRDQSPGQGSRHGQGAGDRPRGEKARR